MVGYGKKLPKVEWPNKAKLALQFVLNYEEGSENSVLNGDKYSETFLSEIIGAKPIKGRHINMESIYEYGSKRGFWRIHELFQEKKIPLTIFGVGMALEKNNDVCAILATGFGKSLCYQLPFLITKKTVLVISPLISLMEDQFNKLKLSLIHI